MPFPPDPFGFDRSGSMTPQLDSEASIKYAILLVEALKSLGIPFRFRTAEELGIVDELRTRPSREFQTRVLTAGTPAEVRKLIAAEIERRRG